MTSKAREIWNSVGVLALAVSSLLGPVEPAAKVGTPPMAVCVACLPPRRTMGGRWGVAPHAPETPLRNAPEHRPARLTPMWPRGTSWGIDSDFIALAPAGVDVITHLIRAWRSR